MPQFDRIGLITRPCEDSTADSVRQIARLVGDLGRELVTDPSAAKFLDIEGAPLPELAQKVDIGVVVGGDGTLLTAARHLAPQGIPVCGVNRGRLGFLAEIYPEQVTTLLADILCGEGLAHERSALYCEVTRDGKKLCSGDAFNDVVTHSYRNLHMIELQIRIDERPLCTLRADGLIVSTPTGSTAYAMSGGGPVLYPTLPVVVLVPICPHVLSSRPIAVRDDSVIELDVIGHAESRGIVSLDGNVNQEILVGDHIRISRQSYPLTLMQSSSYDPFEVLRNKLSWNL